MKMKRLLVVALTILAGSISSIADGKPAAAYVCSQPGWFVDQLGGPGVYISFGPQAGGSTVGAYFNISEDVSGTFYMSRYANVITDQVGGSTYVGLILDGSALPLSNNWRVRGWVGRQTVC